MKLFGPLSRAVVLIGLLLGAGALATPVLAAPADMALLKKYIGVWKGKGTLTGANTETVVCKMSVLDGTGEKVNYAGRCSLAGTQLSVNGTIAYVDGKKHYEAAMTSNVNFTGMAIGVKQGDGIVFNLRETDKDEQGNDMTVTSSIVLSGGKINVKFNVTFNKTGDSMKAAIPFNPA